MEQISSWLGVGVAVLGLFSGGYAGGHSGARARLTLETRQRVWIEGLRCLREFPEVDPETGAPILIPVHGRLSGLVKETDGDRTVPVSEQLWNGVAFYVLGLRQAKAHADLLPWIDRIAFRRVLETLPEKSLEAMRVPSIKLELGYQGPVDWGEQDDWKKGFLAWDPTNYEMAVDALADHLRNQLRPGWGVIRWIRDWRLYASVLRYGPYQASGFDEMPPDDRTAIAGRDDE